VRDAWDQLRPRRRRMRQPPLVRYVHRAGNVRRRWCAGPVRSTRRRFVQGADVRPAERRMRPGRRRMRQPAQLRIVHASGDLRWRRRRKPVRLPRRLLVRPTHMPAAEHQLRSGRRRMRQPGQLRLVPQRTGVRRRRRSGQVRRARLGHVRCDDVHTAGDRLRADGRRMRQPDSMRQLPVGSNVRRRRSRRSVRRAQRRVRSAHLLAAEHQLRSRGRRVRQLDSVRRVCCSGDLRGRRHAGRLRRERHRAVVVGQPGSGLTASVSSMPRFSRVVDRVLGLMSMIRRRKVVRLARVHSPKPTD
jgi:hypothetical protein